MSDAAARPSICLNMIVKNEAHVVCECLDSVAPHISSWVIVDTGSDDGTQDLIRNHMARLGIPGQLYERPWHNFGHNRTEAINLAQGHADYILVMDADDLLVGTPDFTGLSVDMYFLPRVGVDAGDGVPERQPGYRRQRANTWSPQLFRGGLPWRFEGVVHEGITCDEPFIHARLQGDFHIEYRQIGARSRGGEKHARDRDLLLAALAHNPEDARSAFYLAYTYFFLGDFASAREWFTRRVAMGGWDQEVYYAMYMIAVSMSNLGAPWPEVQEAYLRAWEFRPTHAESLYAIARRYRQEQRYQLGYLFAKRAASIPFPDQDRIGTHDEVHAWRAADEQAVCASWIGKHPEAFTLWRGILARPDLTDAERQHIAANRDVCVPTMLDAAGAYPETVVQSLTANSGDPDVAVTLIAGPDRAATEHTLNSFLNCCTDVTRVGRFHAVDAGLTADDRDTLSQRYPFLQFTPPPASARFQLHLGCGWRFFAPENLITRLTAVLHGEPDIHQVGINLDDATTLTARSAPDDTVRRTPKAGRYVLSDIRTDTPAHGPAMIDTTRPDRTGTATLDEVLCITAPEAG